jgi:signal transduction histidine kinase
MTPPEITLAELRAVDLFEDLTDAELSEWVAAAAPLEVEAGAMLVEYDEQPRDLMLLLRGDVEILTIRLGRAEPGIRHRAPSSMGAIALLTDGPIGVRIEARAPCRLALVAAEDFRILAFAQPSVHRRAMEEIAPALTRLTAIEQNRQRLASLGEMAAGLAHELGNPAAAAARAVAHLIDALGVIDSTLASFVAAGVEREEAEQLVALHRRAVQSAAGRTALDAFDAADAEDALQARLEEMEGVQDPWRLAQPLAAAGVDEQWLEQVAQLAGPATGAALSWVAATLTADGLAAELQESTARMTALVGAVKSYAYMDRGDVVEVDLHEGLETTLTVLGHKLKATHIKVVRDYDRDLPKLLILGSELNQVWTNLLDNAIDALGQTGTITIATRADNDCAVIEISDDGAGIPQDVAGRIFDPFFTTKGIGHGTGLGLATARRIVVDRHGGSLSLDTRPGRTAFCTRIPLHPDSAGPAL